jgi:hypothetical protein
MEANDRIQKDYHPGFLSDGFFAEFARRMRCA